MIKRVRHTLLWLSAALALSAPTIASAVVITYQSVDLADLVPGQDLWRYDYSVSGSFVAFGGFNVRFSPTLYRSLENPPPAVNADWLVSTVEPDLGLPADGLYSATALTSNPGLGDPFTLTFVWLGSGAPGLQPFEVFDDSFSVLQIGSTQSPNVVPLPSTLALMCIGLLALARRRAPAQS